MDHYTVVRPVVNLRSKPAPAGRAYSHDDFQETQLLFHETVLVKEEVGGWFLVEAVEQETFRKSGRWEGYPGWVEKDALEPFPGTEGLETGAVKTAFTPLFKVPDGEGEALFKLSMGTRLAKDPRTPAHGEFWPVNAGSGLRGWVDSRCLRRPADSHLSDEGSLRRDLVDTARLFIGTPYLWGGRSMHMADLVPVATGVDCSGLINLLFRTFGVDLPRDAHEQRMRTDFVSPESLQMGDLVFLSSRGGETDHVMLFAGGEWVIEAAETGSMVRLITFQERIGLSKARLSEATGRQVMPVVSFGRAPL